MYSYFTCHCPSSNAALFVGELTLAFNEDVDHSDKNGNTPIVIQTRELEHQRETLEITVENPRWFGQGDQMLPAHPLSEESYKEFKAYAHKHGAKYCKATKSE